MLLICIIKRKRILALSLSLSHTHTHIHTMANDVFVDVLKGGTAPRSVGHEWLCDVHVSALRRTLPLFSTFIGL